jgi:uncharacterized protein (UPF0332 family)
MSAAAQDFWSRALDALRVARNDIEISPDAAASRAYYAAFYAVSAYFILQGKDFAKHSGVEAAVHRELVKTGMWPADLGRGYSRLAQLRTRGDYGGSRHVSESDADEAIRIARDVLRAVAAASKGTFTLTDIV